MLINIRNVSPVLILTKFSPSSQSQLLSITNAKLNSTGFMLNMTFSSLLFLSVKNDMGAADIFSERRVRVTQSRELTSPAGDRHIGDIQYHHETPAWISAPFLLHCAGQSCQDREGLGGDWNCGGEGVD